MIDPLLIPTILAQCDGLTAIEAIRQMELQKLFWCPLAQQIGPILVGVLIFGAILVNQWQWSETIVTPLVTVIVVGGAIFVFLPANLTNTIVAVLVIVTSGMIYLLWRRLEH